MYPDLWAFNVHLDSVFLTFLNGFCIIVCEHIYTYVHVKRKMTNQVGITCSVIQS